MPCRAHVGIHVICKSHVNAGKAEQLGTLDRIVRLMTGSHAFHRLFSVRFQVWHLAHSFAEEGVKLWTRRPVPADERAPRTRGRHLCLKVTESGKGYGLRKQIYAEPYAAVSGSNGKVNVATEWPPCPAEKVPDPVNREAISCAAGVLSATRLTCSLHHVVFCFASPEDAEALSSGRLAQRYGPVPARERSRLFDAHIENATYFPGVGIAGLDRWSGSMARLSRDSRRRVFRNWRRREVVPRLEEAPRVLTVLIAATDQTIEKSRALITEINELLRKRR